MVVVACFGRRSIVTQEEGYRHSQAQKQWQTLKQRLCGSQIAAKMLSHRLSVRGKKKEAEQKGFRRM